MKIWVSWGLTATAHCVPLSRLRPRAGVHNAVLAGAKDGMSLTPGDRGQGTSGTSCTRAVCSAAPHCPREGVVSGDEAAHSSH